jgi:DNA/RNA endonuclease G (NUC1)
MHDYGEAAVTRGHSSDRGNAAGDATKQPMGEWYYKTEVVAKVEIRISVS